MISKHGNRYNLSHVPIPPSRDDFLTAPESPEAKSSIIRFPDTTLAPALKYDIPLPSAFHGRYYIHFDFPGIKWTNEAKKQIRKPAQSGIFSSVSAGQVFQQAVFANPALRYHSPVFAGGVYTLSRPRQSAMASVGQTRSNSSISTNEGGFATAINAANAAAAANVARATAAANAAYAVAIAEQEIQHNLNQGKQPVLYETWSGNIDYVFVNFPTSEIAVMPKIVIREHYKLTTFFGNYGAGKTTKTFSLFPGEETTLYVRSWRRTEQKFRESSSIFDSWTKEAADEFTKDVQRETSTRESLEESSSWEVEASGSLNFGIGSVGGGGSSSGSTHSTRESLARNVSSTSTHHASKKSATRETEITTEREITEISEFENVIERKVKNTNYSRVLNITTRELNQEVITFFSLYDITVAVVNNAGLFDFVPIHAIDDLLKKYVVNEWASNTPNPPSDLPWKHIKDAIIAHAKHVFDFNETQQNFLEQAPSGMGGYWRVVKRTNPDDPNPFYKNLQEEPVDPKDPSAIRIIALLKKVDGVVTKITKNVVKTDGLIVDALLGQGIALDKYALGTQQEVLRAKQIENLKIEKALKIIDDEGDNDKKAQLYKDFFVVCCPEIIQPPPKQVSSKLKQR